MQSQDKWNFESVICTCVTTLHTCYMRIHLFFSQSEECNFFMYSISWNTKKEGISKQ